MIESKLGIDEYPRNDIYGINLDLIEISNEKQAGTPHLSKSKSGILSKDQSFIEFQNLCKNLGNKNPLNNKVIVQNFMEIQGLPIISKKNYEKLPKNRWFFIQAANNSIFHPRTGHSINILRDDIYLFGGIDDKEVI